MIQSIKRALKRWTGRTERRRKQQQEIDALYRLLYHVVHDLEESPAIVAHQTQEAFASQWRTLPRGRALLTDAHFKNHVTDYLTREELQIQPEWFKGKKVLDAGCGNGRWSYAFTKLGAEVTSVDINAIALQETGKALAEFKTRSRLIHSPLESLSQALGEESFDVVFSWGVIHHCKSFNKALAEIARRCKPGGVLYLYLYGRESLNLDRDIVLFKERVRYNTCETDAERMAFLLKMAGGDAERLHEAHDLYAPLINRRLEFNTIKGQLETMGFSDIVRTIDHTELFIRAFNGTPSQDLVAALLPKAQPPYWFMQYS